MMGSGLASGASAVVDLEAAPWSAVSDRVMGGASSGSLSGHEHGLRFAGRLSLAGGGGFASVRRPIDADLSDATGVRLKLCGDGRSYQFRVRLDEYWDGVAWRARFATSGRWQTVRLSWADFEPVFRGRRVAGAGPVVPARIRQIGLMIADRIEGPFALELARIEFVTDG